MTVWPLKFRSLADGSLLFADDAGGFFRASEDFLDRYAKGTLSQADCRFLGSGGHSFQQVGDLDYTAFAYRWSARQSKAADINYLMLVPTLRCNLACSYCQVSRADERAVGYDWTPETLDAVLTYLSGLTSDRIKIEFQGGEPLLRVDLLEEVRRFCRERFAHAEFVVCTNLQRLGPAEWTFLDAADTFVSTSLDGDPATHRRQRTETAGITETFFANLREAVGRLGSGRVSALPTIDVQNPPTMEAVIEAFTAYGIRSIYLRPINYQGFARSRHAARHIAEKWNDYYGAFIDLLIDRNAEEDEPLEEFYFVHCLRRIFKGGLDGHVNIRNPDFLARDYLLIDFDGRFYPTDEARMMTRVGQIDLSIGSVFSGLDREKISALNENATNSFDPDCIHCPYQAYCGVDLIDEISREGRIDLPKPLTDFCRRHTFIFDKIFALIYSRDPKVRRSLALWLGIPDFPDLLAPVHA
ncbi:His-Xaa-Ser system radical SAM maturase HxsB [Consotaella aegiceratis]|uniref:His-Xaa-Ser system radical SAM maturase HxsB n=1 Tax=Consotaella aegiceratis TaxID=3097961 RepID=UPI002F410B77